MAEAWESDPVVGSGKWQDDPVVQGPAQAPDTPLLPSFGEQAAQYAPDTGQPENTAEIIDQFRQAHPYIYGAIQGVGSLIPTPQNLAQMRLPMPSADVPKEEATSQELGQAWRGELGPERQAESITSSALQAAPLLHLPFAEAPFRAGPADMALAEEMRKLSEQPAEKPPVQVADKPPVQPEAAPWQSDPIVSETAKVANDLQPEQPQVTIPPEDIKYAGTSSEFQASNAQTGQRDTTFEQPSGVGSSESSGVGEQERSGSGTSNRAFTETYGENAVPEGAGVDTAQLLDNARTAIRTGAVDPYSVLSQTRTDGIASPKEYAALAAEHERLVNDAVAKQKAGAPDAPRAARAAEDFANALQPHKTAASDLMRLFQGDVNYDLSTPFGMDQYMKAELGRTPTPKERPMFDRMSRDIGQAQTDVGQAVARSDMRVQRHYARVPDIPIEEAAARVKEWLRDCVV